MSKRVLILLAVGIVAIIAAVLLLKYELTKPETEPEEEPEEKPEETEVIEPEPLPAKEKYAGFRKGFKWDKLSMCYIPLTLDSEPAGQPAEFLTPAPITDITPG